MAIRLLLGLFLAGYGPLAEIPASIVRRTIAIGAGMVALFALLFFGGQLLRMDVLADKDRQVLPSATASQLPLQQPLASADPAPAAKKSTRKNLTQNASDGDTSAPPTKDKPTVSVQPSKPRADQKDAGKSSAKASAENDKPKKPAETASRQPNSGPAKSAGLTRPRIVANPRP